MLQQNLLNVLCLGHGSETYFGYLLLCNHPITKNWQTAAADIDVDFDKPAVTE